MSPKLDRFEDRIGALAILLRLRLWRLRRVPRAAFQIARDFCTSMRDSGAKRGKARFFAQLSNL